MRSQVLILLLAVFTCTRAAGPKPVKNIQVNFIGKTFDVEAATTPEDLQEAVEKQAGGPKLTDVTFSLSGKPLPPKSLLREAGVTDGSKIDMTPGAGSMQDLMKQAGVDTDKLDDLMKNMGLDGDGKMPSMEESMNMMKDMMNSPMIQEMLSDPERLEQSRQMILNNPMLKSMMAGMPGMEELLNDKDAWREAMQAAAQMYQNMDPNMIMNMMGGMGGLGDMGGMPGAGGLFDGSLDDSAAAAALDELSEGDD